MSRQSFQAACVPGRACSRRNMRIGPIAFCIMVPAAIGSLLAGCAGQPKSAFADAMPLARYSLTVDAANPGEDRPEFCTLARVQGGSSGSFQMLLGVFPLVQGAHATAYSFGSAAAAFGRPPITHVSYPSAGATNSSVTGGIIMVIDGWTWITGSKPLTETSHVVVTSSGTTFMTFIDPQGDREFFYFVEPDSSAITVTEKSTGNSVVIDARKPFAVWDGKSGLRVEPITIPASASDIPKGDPFAVFLRCYLYARSKAEQAGLPAPLPAPAPDHARRALPAGTASPEVIS